MPYTLELPAQPQTGGYTLELPTQDLGAAQKAASTADATRAIAIRNVVGSALPLLGGTYAPDVAMGGRQVLDALAQMAARATGLGVDDTEAANKSALDQYNSTFRPDLYPGADLARGAGQGVVTGPVTPALKAGGMISAALQGGALGAGQGALTPVYDPNDFWAQKLDQAKTGAEFGAAGGAAGNVVGRMLSPNVGPAQKALVDANVSLTPGQAAGGVFKGIEDRLAGFPVIGDIIKSAQFRGITDFNRAIYAKALQPFGDEGAKVAAKAEVGNEGIKTVGDFLSQKYRDVLPQVSVDLTDKGFASSMGQLTQMASSLPPDRQAQFVNIFKNSVVSRATSSGLMSGETMKIADSDLGRIASSYRGSSSADERALGQAVGQMQANLRDLVASQNPSVAPIVAATDQGWRTLVQMENAGAMLGAKDGIFSPAQFLNAVKKSDKTVRDRAFARGDAYNQDFAQAADKVLPNKVPDSGTAGRIVGPMLLAEHGASMEPLTMGALALGAAPYTAWLGPLVASALTQRTQPLQQLGDLVKRFAPALAFPAGASAQ